jgi:uncharacterized cupin superfamily protein
MAGPRKNAPIASDKVAWTEHTPNETFEIRYQNLSAATGPQPYKIGVSIEELPPGKRNCPAHWHVLEEEHVLILAGELTVRIGSDHHIMRAGDYVRFPAGVAEEHCLFNHSEAVCRYLIIGDNCPNEVAVYPDSNKVNVRSLAKILDLGSVKDYFDGEA